MSAVRNIARCALALVVRVCPKDSRSWGRAMLREMDYAESDWDALRWALGSTAAVCRYSLIQRLNHWHSVAAAGAVSLRRHTSWVVPLAFGVAAAAIVLAISAMALATLVQTSWLESSREKGAELLMVVAVPDAICALCAFLLWRVHKRVASGVLAAGVTLALHSIIYFIA